MAMLGTLTVAERIMLHISQHQKLKESYDVPFDVSQDGIAQALLISRAHAAVELKKLKESGDVQEKLAHIKKGKNKRKVYFLTSSGEEKCSRIREFAKSEGIDVGPCMDLRRARGTDIWKSLSEENRKVLSAAVVFRKPFDREALPETSVPLLPVDRNGKVDLPKELRSEIIALLPKEQLRSLHSNAADYWLGHGDYRERLFHLLESGRLRESEMLIGSKSALLLKGADKDLLDIVSRIVQPSSRHAAKVRLTQAECARLVHDHVYCLQISDIMASSVDVQERFDGLLVKGKTLGDLGRLEEAFETFQRASLLELHAQGSCLECEIADILIRQKRNDEALWMLRSLARKEGMGDAECIERAYLLMAMALLGRNEPSEALRYASKSLAMTKSPEKKPWFEVLAQAYARIGMEEKAREYEAKANPPKKWGEA